MTFGERLKVTFINKNEFYESVGYLANYQKRGLRITSETSQNRWGAEHRMWFADITNSTKALSSVFSAGVGDSIARLNCNEFIEELFKLGFVIGGSQNISLIMKNIPNNYINDFNRGFNL